MNLATLIKHTDLEILASLTLTQRHSSEEDYLSCVDSAGRAAFDEVLFTTRFTDPRRRALDPIKLSLDMDESLIFGASIRKTGNNSAHMIFSRGLILSLQDLIHRALCIEGFFNKFGPNYSNIWMGGHVLHPLHRDSPKHRYFDYSTLDGSRHTQAEIDTNQLPFIGKYISRTPLDKARREWVPVMLRIAIMWILLHEEAHCRMGHLHYREHKGEASNFGETDNPTSFGFDDHEQLLAYKFFELHADTFATQVVFDVILSTTSLMDSLPDHLQNISGKMRLIMTAIGIAIVGIDRSRIHRGVDPMDPDPRTRLGVVYRESLSIPARYHSDSTSFLSHVCDCFPAIFGAFQDVNEIAGFARDEEGGTRKGAARFLLLDQTFSAPVATAQLISNSIPGIDPEDMRDILLEDIMEQGANRAGIEKAVEWSKDAWEELSFFNRESARWINALAPFRAAAMNLPD